MLLYSLIDFKGKKIEHIKEFLHLSNHKKEVDSLHFKEKLIMYHPKLLYSYLLVHNYNR
jgi:hypothetical protein